MQTGPGEATHGRRIITCEERMTCVISTYGGPARTMRTHRPGGNMESPNFSNDFTGSRGSETEDGSHEIQTIPAFVAGSEWRVLFVGGDALWFDQIKGDIASLQPDWRADRKSTR